MVNPNIITNSGNIIPSNQYLDSSYFPSITSNLYGWHLNETSSFSNGGKWVDSSSTAKDWESYIMWEKLD